MLLLMDPKHGLVACASTQLVTIVRSASQLVAQPVSRQGAGSGSAATPYTWC